MAEDAGVLDVGAATDFARNRRVCGADGIDFEQVRVFFPELAVGLERVAGVSFVVFATGDGQVGGNPVVDLGFDGRDFCGGHFVVEIEIESNALGGNIATFLGDVWVDVFLESGKEEMAGGVIFNSLFAVVFEAALEHALRCGLATLALLAQNFVEFLLPVFGQFNSLFVGLFDGNFLREAVGVLEHKYIEPSKTASIVPRHLM